MPTPAPTPKPTPAPTYDLSCDGYSRACLRVKKDGSDSTVYSTSYYCDNDQYWCKNFKRPAKCENQGAPHTVWQTLWCPGDKITCEEAGPNTCILYDRKLGGQSIETDKTKAWCIEQDGYARWDATWCGDPLCDGYCGCGKGGCGKSKCGKGHTNCDPQKPPVDADDLGYCQKLDRNGAPVAGKTCWADGVDYYDKEECCGTSGNSCNKPNSEWHWCEKSDPIDPCEGYCYVGGKKNGGGYFEGKSYCRRKSSMQSRRRVLENYRSNLRLARRRGGVADRLVSRRAGLSRVASHRGALDATPVAFHVGATSNSRRSSASRGKMITCGAKRTKTHYEAEPGPTRPRRGRTETVAS